MPNYRIVKYTKAESLEIAFKETTLSLDGSQIDQFASDVMLGAQASEFTIELADGYFVHTLKHAEGKWYDILGDEVNLADNFPGFEVNIFDFRAVEYEEMVRRYLESWNEALWEKQANLKAKEDKLYLQKTSDKSFLQLNDLKPLLESTQNALRSVDKLVKARSKLETLLDNYKYLNGYDLEKTSALLRQEAHALREDEMKGVKVSDVVFSFKDVAEQGRVVRGKGLLLYAFLTLLLGAISFALVSGYIALFVSFLAAVIQLALFMTVNYISPVINIKAINPAMLEVSASEVVSEQKKDKKFRNIQKFFVDKAWLEALKTEYESINARIEDELSGADVEDLEVTFGLMKSKEAKLNEVIAKSEEHQLPPEDYLRLRRELDVLTSEVSDFATSNSPQTEIILQYDKYSKIRFSSDIEGFNGSAWEKISPTVNLLTMLALKAWSYVPTGPVVFIFKDKIDEGIVQAVNSYDQGQIVLMLASN